MKKLLLLSLLLLLNACATSRNYTKVSDTFVQIQPSHDTLIAQHHTLDSVRITTDTRYRFGLTKCEQESQQTGTLTRDNAVCVTACEARPCRVDTLVTTQVVERWRIQHDTIRTSHTDTIPVIREVIVPGDSPVPWYYRYPALAMYALLGAIVGLVIIKLTLKI